MKKLTRDEREQQESCAWVTTVFLFGFMSLYLNFIYVHFLQEVMEDSIGAIITWSDKVGIDMHVLRNLHLALFENRL